MAQTARSVRGAGADGKAEEGISSSQAGRTTGTGAGYRAGRLSYLSDEYVTRLSPDQLAWLVRGAGIVSDVPADYVAGSLEDYRPDVVENR